MRATITSAGQVTIPVTIREKLQLAPGDVVDFDETAPFLKATKAKPEDGWEEFGKNWKNPFPGLSSREALDELRGPVALPPEA